MNELYDFLGLEPTDFGNEMGWAPTDEGEYWIEFNHRKAKLDDGTVFYILEMPLFRSPICLVTLTLFAHFLKVALSSQ